MKSPNYLGEDFLRKLKINLEQKISIDHELKDVTVEREIDNINIKVRFSPPKQKDVSINDLLYHKDEETDEEMEYNNQMEEYEQLKETTKQKIKEVVRESVIYTIKNYNKIII